jgi:hypothetical protein
MLKPLTTSVEVRYKNIAGWHVFESEELPGLYVASPDPEKAFNDIPEAIKTLLNIASGKNFDVEMEMSYMEFMRRIGPKKRGRAAPKTSGTVLGPTRFLIQAHAT